jgi:hypothetical protein
LYLQLPVRLAQALQATFKDAPPSTQGLSLRHQIQVLYQQRSFEA